MESRYQKVLYIEGNFRILEIEDELYQMDDLKGDSFNKEVNSELDPDILGKEEKQFERDVYLQGVFGYVLEKWNPELDKGWELVDSCFGFVGQFNRAENNHYIVDELKEQIKGDSK